jgi:phosphatidate phosphatase APP1
MSNLTASQQNQARNLTAEIYVVQQGNQNVSFNMVPNVAVPAGLNGGLVAATGGAQTFQLPDETTDQGDFDTFVTLKNASTSGRYLLPGNGTASIQAINYYATNTTSGNATAYLVPPIGITIISDIDDILRVTKIYQPAQGLLNSFANPFTPWMNMPEIYANWSRSIPDFHFHYLTTTPEQITANYMDYIYNYYPLGSFDTRPLNFSDVSATLSIRKFLLEKIFQTYPKRKFILVADTSNSDVMKDYPLMATEFPGQVACILLRNTSATDSGDKFPYDTSGFAGLNQNMFMFFTVPNDLTHLDIVNGQCYNSSVKQNVTFAYQGLPFGAAPRAVGQSQSVFGLALWTLLVVGFAAALW